MKSKLEEAQFILEKLGLPRAQQNEIAGYSLLALAGIKEKDKWKDATNDSLHVTKGIMYFIADHFNRKYAANTRETVRRYVLHQFIQAGIVIKNPNNPKLPINSPNTHYALTDEVLTVIKNFGTNNWDEHLKKFIKIQGKLKDKYNQERENNLVNVTVNNLEIKLSPGKHNEVQKAIAEKFIPRFAPESILLYLGDTARKDLYIKSKELENLGIPITQHSKLPDVVLYDRNKNWLFLIEAVTSHGPMSPKRLIELEEFLINCISEKIYITAFPDFTEFRKHSKEIAWETEVWIVENPDHMIHFNGDKFLGPR